MLAAVLKENAAPTTEATKAINGTYHKVNESLADAVEEFAEDTNKHRQQNSSESEEIRGSYLLQFKAEKMPTLIGDIMPTVGNICLAGGSDTGKSSLLRKLAIDLVSGTNFLRWGIKAKYRNAIFVATEDDQQATNYLLGQQASHLSPDALYKLRFIFETENLEEKLDQKLSREPADLVIIDCFADAFGGDLKDTQKIRLFLHKYQELAAKHQCLILWLHHTAKRTENFEPSKNNLLSGQGFEAKMRMVMELRCDQSDPTLRHLCIVKGNYLPSSYKKESFVLRFDESHFTFTDTGERTAFEFLAKPQEDGAKAKYQQAKEMKEQGLSYEQIASKIGYSSKGTVSKLFEKAKREGWE
jgi:RecA-family ATPase